MIGQIKRKLYFPVCRGVMKKKVGGWTETYLVNNQKLARTRLVVAFLIFLSLKRGLQRD